MSTPHRLTFFEPRDYRVVFVDTAKGRPKLRTPCQNLLIILNLQQFFRHQLQCEQTCRIENILLRRQDLFAPVLTPFCKSDNKHKIPFSAFLSIMTSLFP